MTDRIIKGLEGLITGYRRGGNKQINKHMLLKFQGYENDKEAAQLIGKTVVWLSPKNKRLKGKILRPHGRNGVVRARFEHGLPGEAIGGKVVIV
ncbi:MAG: 50S ribosomal protein L35ae [Promethearchaeota archaeon]